MNYVNWLVVTILALLCGAGLAFSGFSIAVDDTLVKGAATAALFALVARHLPWAAPAAILTALAQLSFCWMASVPLNFMGAAAALPLQDAALAHADRTLGLDWPAMYAFCVERPLLMTYAALFYALIVLFGVMVPLVLGFADRPRLYRFVLAVTVAVVITSIVTVFIPAMGTYSFFGLDAHADGLTASGYLVQLERLPFARDGSMRALELAKLDGIITFPSFHAASAVLSTWAVWSVKRLRPVMIVLAGGMLAATPLCGGHYFSDVIAGIAVSALAIYIANRTARRFA